MKRCFVYYDENNDRIFITDYYHHSAFGTYFYPAHRIIWIGDL